MNRLCAAVLWPGGCAFVLLVLGLSQAGPLVSQAVAEEPVSDEIAIGAFTLNSPPPKAGKDAQGGLSPAPPVTQDIPATKADAPTASTDARGQELFDRAVAALNANHSDVAQRLFEQVIAEAPDSALSKSARGHLAELYRDTSTYGPAEQDRSAGARDGAPTGSAPLADRWKAGESDAQAGTEISRGIAVSAAIEEQFIAEAGDRVFFSTGSAELGARARGVLQAQARFIKLRPELLATIEGHADDAPMSIDEHARLSEARAEAVRQRLIAEGIESQRLTVASWGRDRRISECAEPACAAQNRRAVTVLVSMPARRTDGSAGLRPGAASVAAGEPSLLTH